MPIIQSLVLIVGGYLALGVPVAAYWLARLAPARDPALRGSGRSVRLLLLPGAVALWPVLIAGRPGREA